MGTGIHPVKKYLCRIEKKNSNICLHCPLDLPETTLQVYAPHFMMPGQQPTIRLDL
jgi:hypothetical protein